MPVLGLTKSAILLLFFFARFTNNHQSPTGPRRDQSSNEQEVFMFAKDTCDCPKGYEWLWGVLPNWPVSALERETHMYSLSRGKNWRRCCQLLHVASETPDIFVWVLWKRGDKMWVHKVEPIPGQRWSAILAEEQKGSAEIHRICVVEILPGVRREVLTVFRPARFAVSGLHDEITSIEATNQTIPARQAVTA